MTKTYRFTEEQKKELYAVEKKKDKNEHKRLVALIKKAEGESRETAGIASGSSLNQISFLMA